mgnify:CR=1 FL=1
MLSAAEIMRLLDLKPHPEGVTVDVDERGAHRPWGLVGRARVGSTTLYLRSRRSARRGKRA